MAILSLSLSVLYQAVGGSTRNVRTDEKYAYAVELARSLLADNLAVPRSGVNSRGKTHGGFAWLVNSSPLPQKGKQLPPGSLHNLEVSVSWDDGSKRRAVVLYSVVPGRIKQ
jgi:general secretion pathway protein I